MTKRAVFNVTMTWEGDTDAGFALADQHLDLLMEALSASADVIDPGVTSYLEVEERP